MIEFPRPRRPKMAIDLAPLVDVVFLLLVFFILTSSFLPPALPMELPGASNEEVPPAEPVVVSLDAAGVIAINGEVVVRQNFADAIGTLLLEFPGAAVHFRGDRAAEYGWFLELMDETRKAGARRMHLVHEPR